jgi:hypothetical protein
MRVEYRSRMFRFFAVFVVAAALFGTLYFAGNALEAWESPKPETVAMPKLPKPKKQHARPARATQPVKRVSHAKPSWLVELNATCRRGKRESDSIPQAATPQAIPHTLRRVIRLNLRLNRETANLVARSGNAAAAARLRHLYAQDEALLQRVLNAAEQGRYRRLPAMGRSLIALAKAENSVFVRLGAGACTASADDLQL